MKKNTIIPPINLSRILKEADAMGVSDDLLVIDDLRKFPPVTDPKRLTCLMMGVCKKGVATFAINGKQYELKENDAWILTEGQVLEDLKVSNDCEGIGFMISYMYLYEILKDVRNISTVFLHLILNMERLPVVPHAETYVRLVRKRFRPIDAVQSHPLRRLVLPYDHIFIP